MGISVFMTDTSRLDISLLRSQPILIFGGTVLTMAEDLPVLRDAELLIDQGRIAALGRALTVRPGTRLVDAQGALILPGLVQGHIHLGQTFFRGLAEERALMPWLQERIWPLEAAHDDETAYWCTLLGAAECLLSGTTTIQDIGIGPGARGYLQALVDSRIRALGGLCLMDSGEGLPEVMCQETDAALAETEALGNAFDGAGEGRFSYALNPRFILSCTDELWRGIRGLAERRSWPVHTHALEHRDETELVRSLKAGRDEIEYFDEEGILASDLRMAHGVWLDSKHYGRLAKQRFSVVHCPSANLKLGSGIADIVGMRRASLRVGLGCDGAGCNNGLDAFQEMRLAALLQKMKHGPAAFTGREALRLATIEGAEAIGMAEEVGSLEVGKQADLVVLDAEAPEMLVSSRADPHDLVAFGASRARVRHVFVGGEQLVESGKILHFDLEVLRKEAARALAKLVDRATVDW